MIHSPPRMPGVPRRHEMYRFLKIRSYELKGFSRSEAERLFVRDEAHATAIRMFAAFERAGMTQGQLEAVVREAK